MQTNRVTRVRSYYDDGSDCYCWITNWNDDGDCQYRLKRVGDGPDGWSEPTWDPHQYIEAQFIGKQVRIPISEFPCDQVTLDLMDDVKEG